MKNIYIIIILLGLFVGSCNLSFLMGDKDLKDGYYLTADGEEACIIFSTSKPYRGTGLKVIPAKVVEANYNNKFIIAKSIDKSKSATSYWIIDKSIAINLNDCTDQASCDSVLRSNVTGSLDSICFYTELEQRNIDLKLKNK